jgi:hypothetical protein
MLDVTSGGPRVFQIGFNRCATGALFKLFQNSGVRSLHHMGRKHRKAGDLTLIDLNPQKVIHKNLRRGRPPVEGLDEFTGFFDMEYTDRHKRFENYRYFAQFAEAYPDALFIFNTRDKDRWLRSRIAHNRGKFLQKTTDLMGMTPEAVLEHWAEHYDIHTAEVAAYFADKPHRCLRFEVDRDPIDKLLRFFQPYYKLNPKRWKPVHQTDWQAVIGDYAETLFRVHKQREAERPAATAS